MENPFIDQREILAEQERQRQYEQEREKLQAKIDSLEQKYGEFVEKILKQIAIAKYPSKKTRVAGEKRTDYFSWQLEEYTIDMDIGACWYCTFVRILIKFDDHGNPIGFIGTVYHDYYGSKGSSEKSEDFECSLSKEALADKLKYLYSFDHKEELKKIKMRSQKNKVLIDGIWVFFVAFLPSAIILGIGGGILSIPNFLGGFKIGAFIVAPIVSGLLTYIVQKDKR